MPLSDGTEEQSKQFHKERRAERRHLDSLIKRAKAEGKAEGQEEAALECEGLAVLADRFGAKFADKAALIQAKAYRHAAAKIRGDRS